jgi:hypothetical protein
VTRWRPLWRRPRHRERAEWLALSAALLVTAAALAPVVAVVAQRWGRPYLPVQDQAVIDLRVRDVWSFSANTPLTGPYSRFGWDHPGPLMYYLLALLSGATGEPAWATLVGNALIQGIAVAWVSRLSWKAGGLSWQIPFVAVVTLSYWGTGPWILQQVWNPHVAYPFLPLLLLQCWLVATGSASRLLGLTFVASFLLQTHIGYTPIVLAACLFAVVGLLASEQSAGRRMWSPRMWLGPASLGAALWFVPVVLDTALHPPGNLVALARFYLGLDKGTHQALLGARQGLGYLATEFRWRPPWLGGRDPIDPLTGLASPSPLAWLALPVALIALAWWLARRRGDAELARLAELLAVTFVAGAVTLALVRGAPTPYLFYWRITLGAAVVVLGLTVLVRSFAAGRGLPTAVLCVVLSAGIAASSVSFTSEVAAANGPVSPMAAVAGRFLRELRREGEPRGRFILEVAGSALGGLQGGLFDALAREGAHVEAEQGLGYQFGYGRVATPAEVGQVWYVTEESELYALLSEQPGARVLAVTHPMPARQQEELVALDRTLAAELLRDHRAGEIPDLGSTLVAYLLGGVPGLPPGELSELSRLDALASRDVCLCSVVAFSSKRLPPVWATR